MGESKKGELSQKAGCWRSGCRQPPRRAGIGRVTGGHASANAFYTDHSFYCRSRAAGGDGRASGFADACRRANPLCALVATVALLNSARAFAGFQPAQGGRNG